MATTLDDLNKTIAEMKDVIASNKNADGSRDKVLDEGALVATFTKALNDWQKTTTAENIRKGEHVGPIGNEKAPAIVERGKFAEAEVVVGYNLAFDIDMLSAEYERLKQEKSLYRKTCWKPLQKWWMQNRRRSKKRKTGKMLFMLPLTVFIKAISQKKRLASQIYSFLQKI